MAADFSAVKLRWRIQSVQMLRRENKMIRYNDKIMKDIREFLNNTEDIDYIIKMYNSGYITLTEVIDKVFNKDNN